MEPRWAVSVGLLLATVPICAGEHNRLSEQEKTRGFRLLFDGESMGQWRNYKATDIRPKWRVIDGAMVMTAKGGGDLATKAEFGHFDLRLEYTIAEKGNSGILFRVDEDSTKRNPWMVAPEYQLYDSFTVKPRGDRCAGALYGLVAATEDLARKPGEWNQVRILLEPAARATGRLRFWLNGTQTVDIVVDPAPDSEWSKRIKERNRRKKGTKFELPDEFFRATTGNILLQDHGARVAFRNIRIRGLAKEKPPRFRSIFDGKTFAGWRNRGNWTIEDGALCRAKKGGKLAYIGGALPADFELRFDWKVTARCNSGVKYRSGNFEYQILDTTGTPAKLVNPRRATASIYFGVAPCRDMARKPGQWNTGRIVCKGTVIQHWLNGRKVVDLDYTDPAMKEYVDLLKFHGSDMDFRGGGLCLQDHGGKVWYRSLRLRSIPAGEKVRHESLKPMPIPPETMEAWKATIEKVRKKKAEKKARKKGKSSSIGSR